MQETQIADRLAALGNTTRLRLYHLLVRAGGNGLNVGDLQRLLDVPASTLAHHLTALARAGLVEQERQGRETVSFANYTVMGELVDYLTAECCAGVELPENAHAAR